MPSTRLDIILPCFNPPKGWAAQLPANLQEIQAGIGMEVEITLILVNDGSSRGIGEADIAWLRTQIPCFHYITYAANQGKGHALRQGVQAAQGDVQIYTDIDFPYSTESFVAIYNTLARSPSDIAVGVRDAAYYAHVPLARKIISKLLRWMLKTFLRTKVTDTQCGLKGFKARGRQLFLATRIQRFLFDLEFVFLASNAAHVQLLPVPVQLKPGVEFSKARLCIIAREALNFGKIFWLAVRRSGPSTASGTDMPEPM